MKICQIIYTYPPYVSGGADIYARNISRELVKKGHEVVIITTKPFEGLSSLKASSYMDDHMKVYRFYPLNIFSWIYSAEKSMFQRAILNAIDTWNLHPYLVIKNILKKEKPDVVHIHTPVWISLSVFDAVKSLNLPLIFTVHEYLLLCRRASLLHGNGRICDDPNFICKTYQSLSRRIVKDKPDLVTAPSQFILDILKCYGFFKGSECIKIPLGIELKDKNVVKTYETIDIIYTGALVTHKGVDVLIESFKNLKEKNIRLHIVGKGPEEEYLKEIADNDKRIIFHGFMEGEKLTSLQESANITVMPSVWYENSPMAIYESFMNGTPVIGSKIGGIPELIKEGINGFLFEAGDVKKLQEILKYLIENPLKLNELEKGALESRKNYDINSHIERLEKIYKELKLMADKK